MTRVDFIKLRAVKDRHPRQLSFIDGVLSLFPGHVEGDFQTLADELKAAGLNVERNGPDAGRWPVYGYVSMTLPGMEETRYKDAVKHGLETGDWTVYDSMVTKAQKLEDKELGLDNLARTKAPENGTQAGYLARMQALKEKMSAKKG